MAISSLGAAAQNLGQEQFLQLLVAQVQNQNPLDPVSDTDFIAQLAQFNTLQGINQLNASFSEMLKLQQLTNGADLLGRNVQFRQGDTVASGRVQQVVSDGDRILLRLQNSNILVPLSDVTGVTA